LFGFRDLVCRQAVEHAILAGRGNVELEVLKQTVRRYEGSERTI
jgi:hypothetical protein